MSTTTAAPRKLKAFWAGGLPGRLRKKIQEDLAQLGITIERHAEKPVDRIPSGCDLVLINLDMSDQILRTKVSKAATNQGIRWCNATMNIVKTTQYLRNAGVIREDTGKKTPQKTDAERAEEESIEPVIREIPTGVKRIRAGNVDLFEENGDVCAVAIAATGGRRRRMYPVLVEDTLFLSYASAASFLDVSSSKIADSLRGRKGSVNINGFGVRLPSFEEASQHLSSSLDVVYATNSPSQVMATTETGPSVSPDVFDDKTEVLDTDRHKQEIAETTPPPKTSTRPITSPWASGAESVLGGKPVDQGEAPHMPLVDFSGLVTKPKATQEEALASVEMLDESFVQEIETPQNSKTRIIRPEQPGVKMFRATRLKSGRVIVEPINVRVYEKESDIPQAIMSLCEWDD